MKKVNEACRAVFKELSQALEATPLTGDVAKDADVIESMYGKYDKKKTSFWDKAVSYQINAMLSGLGTPVANALSVAFKAAQTPINDLIVTAIRKGRGEDVAFAEVGAGFKEAVRSFHTAMTMMRHGYDKGYPLDYDATVRDIALRMDISTKKARENVERLIMESKATKMAEAKGTKATDELQALEDAGIRPTEDELKAFVNDSYDYMRNAFTGPITKYINVPTKVTVAIDELGKSLFRMYKIGQLASRKAMKDAKNGKGEYQDLYEQYMKEATDGAMEGSAEQVLRNLEGNLGKVFGTGRDDMRPYTSIKEYALREMFQERLTGMPRTVHENIKQHPMLRLFVPFMKTPWNIVKESSSYFPAVAPILKKALPAKFDDKGVPIATKMGAYYDLSWDQMMARQMVGSAYFAGIISMMDSETITGSPQSAAEAQSWKDANKPPQSIKIGDTWIGYGRIEPIATVMQMAAELRRVADEYYETPNPDKAQEEALKGLMYGVKAALMDKTFISGLNDLISSGLEADPSLAAQALARQATPALGAQVARLTDDKERQASTITEKVQQRIPYLRNLLPEEYGLYGGPREGNLMQEATSLTFSSAERTPLQEAMVNLDLSKMRPSDKLKGVGLDNEQLAQYRKETAELLTPRLERFVASAGFQRQPKGKQKYYLSKEINRLKRGAINRFAAKLYKTDPDMARKMKNVEYERLGYWDRIAKEGE